MGENGDVSALTDIVSRKAMGNPLTGSEMDTLKRSTYGNSLAELAKGSDTDSDTFNKMLMDFAQYVSSGNSDGTAQATASGDIYRPYTNSDTENKIGTESRVEPVAKPEGVQNESAQPITSDSASSDILIDSGEQVSVKNAEALNHPFDEPKQWEIREINEIMNNCIEGWRAFSNPRSFAKYGRQRGWERIPLPDNEPSATGSNLTDGFHKLTEEEARQMELPF